jgi:hypothetical protein
MILNLFDYLRTTEHLSYIIDSKMRHDRHFQNTGIEVLRKIFGT